MSQGDIRIPLRGNSFVSEADIPRVVEKSMNSVSAFGAKSSVHSLAPPFPTEPTSLGFGGNPGQGQPPLHKGGFGAAELRNCKGNLQLHHKGAQIATPV